MNAFAQKHNKCTIYSIEKNQCTILLSSAIKGNGHHRKPSQAMSQKLRPTKNLILLPKPEGRTKVMNHKLVIFHAGSSVLPGTGLRC
jgi:hypothetical protein